MNIRWTYHKRSLKHRRERARHLRRAPRKRRKWMAQAGSSKRFPPRSTQKMTQTTVYGCLLQVKAVMARLIWMKNMAIKLHRPQSHCLGPKGPCYFGQLPAQSWVRVERVGFLDVFQIEWHQHQFGQLSQALHLFFGFKTLPRIPEPCIQIFPPLPSAVGLVVVFSVRMLDL